METTNNLKGFKLTLDDPDMGLWSYAYDALGNLTRQTDARGQRICLYYDPLNRLAGKHYQVVDSCHDHNLRDYWILPSASAMIEVV